jgi:hypothetical protein
MVQLPIRMAVAAAAMGRATFMRYLQLTAHGGSGYRIVSLLSSRSACGQERRRRTPQRRDGERMPEEVVVGEGDGDGAGVGGQRLGRVLGIGGLDGQRRAAHQVTAAPTAGRKKFVRRSINGPPLGSIESPIGLDSRLAGNSRTTERGVAPPRSR